ncbi:MFS transporter [Streptomyces sp. SID7909]|uniref:MFS transporter n=1 Tax=Streptomyces sp. SID7909 TaxID=2706092 RepID=UPI0013B64A35|nr:MFS transporter [Streptomyces sp. SID7909]NEC06567.1 MFS transporter [Streptomyces sp. SID7909]
MTPVDRTSGSRAAASRRPATAWLVTALLLSVGSYQLNNTMVGPANAKIIESLHTDTATVGLAQTLFAIVGAISAIVVTRISDWTGRRRALLFSLSTLVVGNVIVALAPGVGVYIAGRALSGMCGAVFAFAFLILHDLLDLKTFSKALAVIAAIKAGLGGVEAVVSGSIVDSFGYRGVFWCMVGFTLVAVVCVYYVVPEITPAEKRRLDWQGSIVIALGLAGLSLALSQGGKWGWSSTGTLAALAGGLVFLCSFPLVEKRVKEPLIRTGELASRKAWPLLLTNVLTLAGAGAATLFVLPLLAQNESGGFGMSATTAALLYTMPVSVVGFAFAPVAGTYAPRIGWRVILLAGLVITVIGLAVLAAFSDSSRVAFAMTLLLGACYTGLVLTALDGLGVLLSSAEAPGALTGFNTAAFGIGASLGIAVSSGIITQHQVNGAATHSGYATALWTCTGLAFLGLLVSFLIPGTSVGEVAEDRSGAGAVAASR